MFRSDAVPLKETAIIGLMALVAPILPLLLTAAALAAQFSAAVADTSGSGGLIEELTGGTVSVRVAYALLVVTGLALTWALNVFEIITYASRAFAFYYAIQSAIAAAGAARQEEPCRGVFFGDADAAWPHDRRFRRARRLVTSEVDGNSLLLPVAIANGLAAAAAIQFTRHRLLEPVDARRAAPRPPRGRAGRPAADPPSGVRTRHSVRRSPHLQFLLSSLMAGLD